MGTKASELADTVPEQKWILTLIAENEAKPGARYDRIRYTLYEGSEIIFRGSSLNEALRIAESKQRLMSVQGFNVDE
jgi:hypothetical protein